MESSCAYGNQSNDCSTQLNGPVRQEVRIHLDSARVTPARSPPPELPSVSDTFYLGPIPVLDEDRDGHDGVQLRQRPSPIINKDDVECISDMGIEIRHKYELVLGETTGTGVACVEQLSLKVESQKGRIDVQGKIIEQWSRSEVKPRRGDVSILVSPDTMPDSRMQQRTDDIKRRFQTIHGKLDDAVDELQHIPKQSQSRKGEGRIKGSNLSQLSKLPKSSKVSKSSKAPRSFGASKSSEAFKILEVFENLKEFVGQIERDIVAIESHVYQLSGCPLLSKSTNGFDTLFVSSSATRTLYRHLCQACPARDQHSHTALVSLVPEKEPHCIVPDDIAITIHHVAIESTFREGDYIWFEAQSTLLLPGGGNEAVFTEPSSPQAVMDELRQWLRRDSGYSSASSSLPSEQIQLSQRGPESRDLYRIKVCPGSLAQGSDGLAMCIGSDQGSGCHEMRYLDEERRPRASCKPLNLSDIIRQGKVRRFHPHPDLWKQSHKLRNDRYKIAFKIAEAALRYGWREWLGDTWGIQNIEFHPYESENMPFLRAKIVKHGCSKLETFMFNLGFVFLQLGLWELLDICTSEAIFGRDLENQLTRLSTKTSAEFHEAVRYCCEFARYGDCQEDDNDFHQTFYQKVISPLRAMAKEEERQN
ncbi:hypothetical protein NW754_003254 [Fusarium falciforme]|nr:hypothetical protein NW754_003254 [Fusarium falciforme]